MRNLTLKSFVTLFVLCVLACQETDDVEIQEAPQDLDMTEAWTKSEEFLNSARTESVDVDVTVIKYQDDLAYKTNTITGQYEPINVETITAESQPGGYIFWYAGGGIDELIQIEMDQESAEALNGYLPFEVLDGLLWALWVPFDYDAEVLDHLKYDIVYKSTSGEVIRLDPKIQIKHQE